MKTTDVIKFFENLTIEEIRTGQFLQYTDRDIVDSLDHFHNTGDTPRFVALIEAVLHSPEHTPDMVGYDELYLDAIAHIVPFRTPEDNIALSYARLAYAVQHGYTWETHNAWYGLILEYLAAETSGKIEIGLHLVQRYIRSANPKIEQITEIIQFLIEEPTTKAIAEALLDSIHEKVRALNDPERLAFWAAEIVELQDAARGADDTGPTINPTILDDLADAIAAMPTDEPEELEDITFASHSPIDRLADLSPGMLSDEVLAQAEVVVPELIYLALAPSVSKTSAADQAVVHLQYLWRERLLPLEELAPWLEKAQGNWRLFLSDRICKVGFLLPDELKALAANVQANSFVRGDAVEVLIEITRRLPDLTEDVKSFIRYLLTRPESRQIPTEEFFITKVIAALLDAPEDWKELQPEVESAFRNDIVDPEIILVEDVEDEWHVHLDAPRLPQRSDGEYVLLKCKKCGRARYHFVKNILLDLGSLDKISEGETLKYDPFIMDHEIVCPKCGARDAYEVSPLQSFRLFSLAFADDQPADKNNPLFLLSEIAKKSGSKLRIRKAYSAGLNEEKIHPLELRDRYLTRTWRGPQNPQNYLAMANIYKNLFRDEQALEMARKAYELGPNDVEIILLRAMAEHDAGDKEIARKLYQKVIEMVVPSHRSSSIETMAIAREGLRNLKRGQPSPWALGVRDVIKEKPQRKKSTLRRPLRKKKKRKKRKR